MMMTTTMMVLVDGVVDVVETAEAFVVMVATVGRQK